MRHCLLLITTSSLLACSVPDPEATETTAAETTSDMAADADPPVDMAADVAESSRCERGASCAELVVEGDPIEHGCLEVDGRSTLSPCPIRGHFDPSLERDPETGTLWMSYSSATLVFVGAPDPANVRGALNTELARSDDGGVTWTWVATVNTSRPYDDPEGGAGMLNHEISTISKVPGGDWVLHWLQFVRLDSGVPYHRPVIMERRAASPQGLVDATPRPHLGALASSREFAADFLLHELFDAFSSCAGPTEPGLFAQGGRLRSALVCIGVDLDTLMPDSRLDSVELITRTDEGYRYDAQVLAPADARALVPIDSSIGEVEAVVLTQPAVVPGREPGTWFLLVTPAVFYEGLDIARHDGCMALEFEDIERGVLRRDADGIPLVAARIEAPYEGNLGPGLCAYDPASDTGVLMVLMRQRTEGGIETTRWSIHSTGVML